ncbi:AfsR/SARP family transcriptional regulator [Modestobacter excelsi]|uniref:AfsR/SARP family transcriptional regulator n=1 Tax=Modestobacter excelsi TaxID=2213161 RepID=UPI00110CA460|nr:BTAD domain-containing putative transcriptional regulator [Modestobacter excelsi]
MNLLVLGPLEVWRDGVSLAVRRGRPRRLLLSLVLRRGGAVPQDTLIDQLWGDEPPVNAENALQVLVSYLRRAVGGDDLRIERVLAGYRLVVAPDSVDMVRAEALVATATATDVPPLERLSSASAALALWRGPALSEARDDSFAQGDISRLEELRLLAWEARAEALLAVGRHVEALPELSQLVHEHPFRERLHGSLAVALYRSGRQAEALAALEAARTTLADELGLDLSRDLQELEHRILRQDRALEVAPHDRAAPTAEHLDSAPARQARVAADPTTTVGAVPPSLTSLVGREEQVAAVAGLLDRARVVTLTGPGGAGKTRLAAESARRRREQVWWVDLSAATDRTAVVDGVTAAAGAVLTSDEDPVAALARWVGDRDALLVLDTCEHVVAPAEELVTALVIGCPRLRVLATSRRPLGVAGELTWPVPPLSLPPPDEDGLGPVRASHAVQLFCARAATARPGFVLSEGNAAAVATVCRLLDGLPLAIELAAGHAAALSPAKTAELLADRLRLDGPGQGRHAGLRATIDWSYGLLSAGEALFLDRLSVFRGPFVIDAAVEVAGAGLEDDGLTLLLSLVRQSLVAVAEDDHFRLLDTIRARASARLAARPQEELTTRDRHARWFRQFAEEADRTIRGADQAGWLTELRNVSADLRAALAHCLTGARPLASLGATMVCSLSWFWSFEGSFAEARRWIDEATAAGPHDPLTTARLQLAAGMHAESVGDLDTAEHECTRAAAAFAELGDEPGEARSLLHLGTVRWARGRLPEAAAAQDRSIALFRSQRHDAGAGLGLVLRARTALDAGDPARARDVLAEAQHVVQRSGDQHLVGLRLEQHARVGLDAGDLTGAESSARASLEVFEQVGYPEGIGAALQTLGRVHLAQGDPLAAQSCYLQATEQALRMAHRPAVVEGVELLAEAAAVRHEAALAARLLGHAQQLRLDARLDRTTGQQRRLDAWRHLLGPAPGAELGTAEAAGRHATTEELLAQLRDVCGYQARVS